MILEVATFSFLEAPAQTLACERELLSKCKIRTFVSLPFLPVASPASGAEQTCLFKSKKLEKQSTIKGLMESRGKNLLCAYTGKCYLFKYTHKHSRGVLLLAFYRGGNEIWLINLCKLSN